MTVRYQLSLESAKFGKLGKLLLRWRGSIYKLLYREFAAFAAAFALISLIYRLVLGETQRKTFEKLCLHLEETINLVPLTFVLGFYVSFVLSRWWEQLIAYPWPDRMSYLIIHWINGQDERSYMVRRQLVRYITAATIFVNRPYSVLTRKRFPTLQHMVDAGILSKDEKVLFDSITEIKEHGKFWVPCVWFTKLLDQARREGLMPDDPMGVGSKQIMDELLVFRAQLGRNWMYNWVPIPVAYTQVVTLAVYTYFVACLFARQPLDVSKNYKGHGIDTYFPIFTTLQFLFYVGWLKVAETIFNPWGEDDDDFDINWFIERHMQVHFTVTDQMFDQPAPLVKDKYWGTKFVQLPPLNKKNETLKPGDLVPPHYIDNYGRECHWPPSPPPTPNPHRFAKPKSPAAPETTITMDGSDITPTAIPSHNSSFRSYGTSLSRAVYWDGSPIFNPRSQKWPLLKDEYLSSLGAAARAPVSPPRMALLREVVWSAYALFSHPPAFQTLENPAFRDGLDALQGLLSRLQLADLGLDERRLEELVKEGEGRARVLYMSVVDAEAAEKGDPPPPHPPPHSPAPAARDPANVMTVAAFVVAPGGRLPLHDHPKMYGLLRLLHGQLTVYSYSSVGRAPSRPGRSQPCLLASKHPQKTVTPDSPPLVLRKNHEDIHAIHNDSQTTALFVDVLAPPYDFRKCDPDDEECSKGHRFISYYEEAGAATEADGAEAAGRAECVVLEEVPCPEWFNTDHVPYTGPSLL